MTQPFVCDAPHCPRSPTWFIGLEFKRGSGDFSRGHTACDVHLAAGCRVTLLQLHAEGEADARLDVRPFGSVEAVIV